MAVAPVATQDRGINCASRFKSVPVVKRHSSVNHAGLDQLCSQLFAGAASVAEPGEANGFEQLPAELRSLEPKELLLSTDIQRCSS